MNFRDPHAIYKEYFSVFQSKFGENCAFTKRQSWALSTRTGLMSKLLVILADGLILIGLIFVRKSHTRIVREFSAKSLLIYFFLLPFLPKNIAFNINHNLNSSLEVRIIDLLSKRLSFCFIGAGPKLRKNFPNFVFLDLPKVGFFDFSSRPKKLVVFVGAREEQEFKGLTSLAPRIRSLASKLDLELVYVGNNSGKIPGVAQKLSFAPDLNALVSDALVLFLYNPRFYERRHSGVFWKLLEVAPILVAPESDAIIGNSVCREFRISLFDSEDYDDLFKKLECQFAKTA